MPPEPSVYWPLEALIVFPVCVVCGVDVVAAGADCSGDEVGAATGAGADVVVFAGAVVFMLELDIPPVLPDDMFILEDALAAGADVAGADAADALTTTWPVIHGWTWQK